MKIRDFLLGFALPMLVGLSACGQAEIDEEGPELDPMVQRALNDPIMVDQDLVSQNMANAALDFSIGHPIPPENVTPSTIIDAREKALEIVGGSSGLKPLPVARPGNGLSDAEALNALGRLQRLTPAANCREGLRFSAVWAAKVPDALAIYPRGSTKEGLGRDGDCRVRVALYLTPVPLEDVIPFHYTRAVDGGYSTELAEGEGWTMLSGQKPKASFEIAARSLPSGLNEVSIVSIETN